MAFNGNNYAGLQKITTALVQTYNTFENNLRESEEAQTESLIVSAFEGDPTQNEWQQNILLVTKSEKTTNENRS